MDPKPNPQDDELVELDDDFPVDESDEALEEPDEDELLKEYDL